MAINRDMFWVYFQSNSGRKTVAHRFWTNGLGCGRAITRLSYPAGKEHKRCKKCLAILDEMEALEKECGR